MQHWTVTELLMSMVSIPSDGRSGQEARMGEWLYELIKHDEYFAEHLEDCGADYGTDRYHRPVVWAFKRGRSNKTVLLTGHYDTVDLEDYGRFAEYALDPGKLKEAMLLDPPRNEEVLKDLQDDSWMFGRGTADMKAGLAAALYTLFTEKDPENSILFTAVCDEENVSAGMRAAVSLCRRLKERYHLSLRLCILGEPQLRSTYKENEFAIYAGGMGKLLPFVVAKGEPAYMTRPLDGLNADYMIAKIISDIEMNTSLITEDRGMAAQPPSVQMMKDFKSRYDAMPPEYACCYFNLMFLGAGKEKDLMKKFMEICRNSMAQISETYKKTCQSCAKIGAFVRDRVPELSVEVMELQDLEEYIKGRRGDYEQKKKDLIGELEHCIFEKEASFQKAVAIYIGEMIKLSEISKPLLVIGIAPPYYPSVTVYDQDVNVVALETAISEELAEFGLRLVSYPYCPGMTDISYLSCLYPEEEEKIEKNLSIPQSIYDIPLKDMHALNIPTYIIGARSKGIHMRTERVYLPDVESVLPRIYHRLVNH